MGTTPQLTTRRAILLSELADGKTMAQATATARMQRQSGYEALEEMRALVPKVMDDVGLDVHSILARIREKCDATETKFFQYEGRVTQRVDVEAHGIQLKAIELAASLRPELAQIQDKLSIGTVNIMWAGQSPDWASAKPEAIPVSTDNDTVHSDILESKQTGEGTISAIEGTGAGPAASPHTHSGKSALSERVKTIKKRKPRLPVFRGDK